MSKKSGSAPWLEDQPAEEVEQPVEVAASVDVTAAIDALGAPAAEPTETEKLQAQIDELRRQLAAAAVGEVTLGPTGTVVDFALERIVIPTPQGEAVYDYVGDCSDPACSMRTFRCTSHPVRADQVLGAHFAILTPNHGDPVTPVSPYCQRHDPTVEQKRMGVSVPVGQRATINGETWSPMTERQSVR